jgi:guanine deaminase
MLEVSQALMHEHEDVRFQSHLNENQLEIDEVARLFPWAQHYFDVYDRYGLSGPRAVLAHNVHPQDAELEQMSSSRTFVAHCPCSNSALGSGVFPMGCHLDAGVPFALGTDVGGGTGFGMMKEALQSYFMQRLSSNGVHLDPAKLLYLATLAGAEAVGLDSETGNFEVGKSADIVYLEPSTNSPLAFSLERAESGEAILATLFAQVGQENVREVRVEGSIVYQRSAT